MAPKQCPGFSSLTPRIFRQLSIPHSAFPRSAPPDQAVDWLRWRSRNGYDMGEPSLGTVKFGTILPIALCADVIAASPQPLARRQQPDGIAKVDLPSTTGEAKSLGANIIYGFPDNGVEAQTVIPDHFITDIKFHVCRAGGAQIPDKGWGNGGYAEYIGRFNSTLSNYRTTREYGGDFILFLLHDLWSADGVTSDDGLYPGDNGDFSEFEKFLKQVKRDLEVNDILDSLAIDV
ncbi:hypothetical protein N7489_004113 [Penicillium chrysogenum]|uniref:uncharacterized protein n=1 Tax=Penicillium chrysogenum TaxID=5076 RepID=UPI0024DF0F24|nr:uncharacterized protein N7489_004113 [Penicillium chrysogenum]KAJ5244017.1 hypothetical protein N7489_004113 [Penicillium chrysogenum]